MNIVDKFARRQKRIMITILLAIITVVIIVAFMLTEQGNDIAENRVQSYLSELSYQTSYKVNQRMDTNLNTLQNLNDQLNIVSETERQKMMDNTAKHSAFREIGYIDTKGIFITNNTSLDISNTNVAIDMRNGNNESISDKLIELENGQKGVIYAISNQENGNALAGFIPTDTMLLLLNTNTFKGDGFSHVVSMDGDYILKSSNSNAILTQGNNFFEELYKAVVSSEEKEAITAMEEGFKTSETGTIQYTVSSGDRRTLTYVPLEKGDWYLLSIVPSGTFVNDIDQFTDYSILAISGVSILLFSVLSAFIFLTSMKKLSDVEYVDPVTLGFTKARFDGEIRKLFTNFSPFTYVVLDIRKFKLINDLVGSDGGDDVLRHVYRCVEKYLGKDEFVARLQADYFEIVLKTTDKKKISEKLLAIAQEINKFNENRDRPYYLPIDCGIYIVNEITDDLVIIRDRANSARKNSKESSHNHHLCSCVYYNDMERLQMVHEKEIDNNMEKALEDEEFIVYLQPKVNISTNKVVGAEALIRWNSPTMGFLTPNKFIPYFEKNGFIVQLDTYVFKKVCQQIRKWIDEGKEPLPISVNMSRRDLYDNEYLEQYKAIQKEYHVPSHLLEIEFTETLFFENLEMLKQSVEEVHEAGYRCSIDDFGSGYSSLSLLKEVPVDILKLDKTFFDDISNTCGDKVVEHVIALANDLNMSTIAEGVENLGQVKMLQEMKCDLVQGYVFYKPLSIEDFNKIVEHDYEIIPI